MQLHLLQPPRADQIHYSNRQSQHPASLQTFTESLGDMEVPAAPAAVAAAAAGGAEVEGGAGRTSEEMDEGAEGDTSPPALEEEPAEELSGGCSPPGLRPPLDGNSWLSERMSPTPALPRTHPKSQ